MKVCVDAEGHLTVNHTIRWNVLKLKKQWFIMYLYSGIAQHDFKKGVHCRKKNKKNKTEPAS